MKQFILKNIVLIVILALTFIGSVVLISLIIKEHGTIETAMAEIQEKKELMNTINAKRNPNSVKESEILIKADTEAVKKKVDEVYRHFGKPYRPALINFLTNIASKSELKTDLPVDPTLVAEPKPKTESDEGEDEDAEVAEAEQEKPAAPTKEEKAVFDASTGRVVLSFDEDTLREMLEKIYGENHQDNTDDDSFSIPYNVQGERAQMFKDLFNEMIEAPDVVDPSRAEAFRTAAAEKFAHAFAIFRDEVQKLTLEEVTYDVARELFLDAIGLPRLMRQDDCKSFIEIMWRKYCDSDIIPGLPASDDDRIERERLVQSFIYGKNLNQQTLPMPEMVIPIIRNIQIKEDLFRKMKESGITALLSMDTTTFYGATLDSDTEGPILAFTYTLEMTASMEAIDAFINDLQGAYKSDRVYVVSDIKLSAPYEDLINANAVVAAHMEDTTAATRRTTTPPGAPAANQTLPPGAPPVDGAFVNQPSQQTASAVTTRSEYELTDPRNPEYGVPLIGEVRDEIKCTMVVKYLLYRAKNITPQ